MSTSMLKKAAFTFVGTAVSIKIIKSVPQLDDMVFGGGWF